MKFPLPFCILFQICFFVVSSHRHGAPNKSCHKMIPHHKHLKLDGQGAYLKINQTDANQLELTLATTNDKSFKGFILQGRDDNGNIIGKFLPSDQYKMMTCDHRLGNSITHRNSGHKSQIKAQWVLDSMMSNVTFHCVVVFHYRQAQKLQHLHKFK